MKIIRAEAMGFCFGVRDALKIAETVDAPELVTIRGELVHNESVVQELRQRGFEMTSENQRETVPSTPVVMLTAHGASRRERNRLQEAGKQLIDTTCPLVRNAWQAAQQFQSDGYFLVVIGRKGHVEVEGLVGDLEHYSIVGSVEEVIQWEEMKLGVISQTTTPPRIAREIVRRIEELNPASEIRFRNTICQPTLDRQRSVEELAERVDLMVVIGGKNSHNTNQLAALCRSRDVPTVRVQSAADLVPGDFTYASIVGLTAGTSTPDDVIDEVEASLKQFANERDRHRGLPTSLGWIVWFRKNKSNLLSIPWQTLATITPAQRRAIGKSIQIFQRGESGEGLHFLKCAERHANNIGDPDYTTALELFIQEEQRHAADLGRVLKALHIPRIDRTWTDSCFRWLRHRAGLDLTIAVLVTAEILAMVYYAALARTSESSALQTLCRQILRDEVMHIRFQICRLFELRKEQSMFVRKFKIGLHRSLFSVTSLILWTTHRSVFRMAGISCLEFRRQCRREWVRACKQFENGCLSEQQSP